MPCNCLVYLTIICTKLRIQCIKIAWVKKLTTITAGHKIKRVITNDIDSIETEFVFNSREERVN